MTIVSGTSNSSLKETGFFGVSVSSNLKAEFSSSQIDRKNFHDNAALHRLAAYKNLMNEEDVWNLKWLQVFKVLSTSALSDAPLVSPSTYCMFLINFPFTAKYDLYSKSKVRIDVEEVKSYYLSFIEKYFPAKLNWCIPRALKLDESVMYTPLITREVTTTYLRSRDE
ncbi:hypothetical protein ACOSQ3_019999 [Xanthoceras sorbifolium]